MNSMDTNMTVGILWGAVLFLLACIAIVIVIYGKRVRRAERLAVSDPVTGGRNGEGFRRAAEKCLSGASAQYAVVMMNVGNYRQICSTFGGDSGDRLLVWMHGILKSALSGAEPFGRVAGGTSCFLLKNRQEDVIQARLQWIRESAGSFNQRRRIPYDLDLRFGVYVPRENGESLGSLQEKAAQAMERCTEEARFGFYEDTAGEPSSRIWELIEQMDRSLQNGDFLVYMQPKVRLGDSRVVGAEALVRWRHPQRGMLTPEMFVPLLEEYHVMHRLDEYLFERVCRKLAQWKKAGWKPCPISVNLSRDDLNAGDFPEFYAGLCQRYGIEPKLIEFELSEDILNRNIKELHKVVEKLHTCGFQCALDNFGRTWIPMHLLRELDVDVIKLDGSFFCTENNSRRNRFVIEAILKLANQMRIRTVAEGIDNSSQVQYLQQAACDMIQGLYYFRPMPLEEFQKTVYQDKDLRYVEAEGARSGEPARLDTRRTTDSNIVMFSLLTGEDRVAFSAPFSPLLEGQLEFSGALALFRQSNLIHENDRKDFFHLLERCRKEEGWVENTLRFYTSEGHYEWLEVHLHREFSPAAGDTVISGTLVNVAGWKNEVNRWKEKANRDALTGLYNREYFEQFIANCLEKGSVTTGAFVFIDVDDFKRVNDTLGHVIGDDVLCWVAKRILGVFRHTDIVARYGGDEFVVFVNGIGREHLKKRLGQLCEEFRFPYRNGAIEYPVSGSIGAAMFPEDGRTYQELLNNADSAAYEAKGRGKNRFELYRPGMEGDPSAQKK